MEPKKQNGLEDIFSDDPFGLLNSKLGASGAMDEDARLLDSFGEIQMFYETYDRAPSANSGVQESSLYYRLKALAANPAKRSQLEAHDKHGLLQSAASEIKPVASIDDILASDALGILDSSADSIFDLKHVSPKQTTMPDYIASRKPCKDFKDFEQLFIDCQASLKAGKRALLPFRNEQQIGKAYFFVLKGILLYVAEVGELEAEKGKKNARLRCIFENGTESDMLLRSLAAELYKDGRRITEHDEKMLDGLQGITDEDEEAGYIYILQSLSTKPEIASVKNLYKIGFSKTDVDERVKNAAQEPTYLMAPVRIMSVFKCYNMNPQKLEQLAHNFFGSACLDVDVFDNAGKRHIPREWFIAPLPVVEDAIQAIVSGEIVRLKYDARRQEVVVR